MPVYKDKKRNTWYIRLRKKDTNDEWKHLTRRGFPTKREAQEEEARLKLREVSTNTSLTFYQLYLDYMNNIKTKLKLRSIYTIEYRFKKHVLPYFKNTDVNNLTIKQYQNWKEQLNNKNYSANYMNSIHTCIVALFNYGIKYHNINRNIPSILGGLKKPSEINKDINFWDYNEFNKFINNVDDLIYKTLFSTLYYTGARIGEVLALTWKDVKGEQIIIKKSISKRVRGSDYLITNPKTKSSNRIILAPKKLKMILKQYYEYQKKYDGFNDSWFLFEGHRPLPKTTITRKKDEYCKLANVKRIRTHDFRHSHASLLINNGANPTIVAQRLGHSDIAMTLNTYSHMFPNSQKEIIKLIDNL